MSLYYDFEHEPDGAGYLDACLESEFWRTKDGKILKIKDMEDSHIVNIVNKFNKKRILPYLIMERYNKIIIKDKK